MIQIKDEQGNTLHEVDGETLEEAFLAKAYLRKADLRGANLKGAVLRDADLREADLSGADLRGADLTEANLAGARLCDATLVGATIKDTKLQRADLSRVDLSGVTLDVRGDNLMGATLAAANLRNAELTGSSLSNTDLRGANLQDARLFAWGFSEMNVCGTNLAIARAFRVVRGDGRAAFAHFDRATRWPLGANGFFLWLKLLGHDEAKTPAVWAFVVSGVFWGFLVTSFLPSTDWSTDWFVVACIVGGIVGAAAAYAVVITIHLGQPLFGPPLPTETPTWDYMRRIAGMIVTDVFKQPMAMMQSADETSIGVARWYLGKWKTDYDYVICFDGRDPDSKEAVERFFGSGLFTENEEQYLLASIRYAEPHDSLMCEFCEDERRVKVLANMPDPPTKPAQRADRVSAVSWRQPDNAIVCIFDFG